MLFESTWIFLNVTQIPILKLFTESIKLKKKYFPKYQIKQVKFVSILLRNITLPLNFEAELTPNVASRACVNIICLVF